MRNSYLDTHETEVHINVYVHIYISFNFHIKSPLYDSMQAEHYEALVKEWQ
jgi:hypothetical protein